MLLKAVKVHCGSAHVCGLARKYPYFVASLFESYKTKQGRIIWKNVGCSTTPRRSRRLAEEDGKALARANLAMFVDGYGSLHNQKI